MTNTNCGREIPLNWPTTITITIHWDGEHQSWQGHYLPPGATHFHDFTPIVVNFACGDNPREGDLWEVEPVNMAPTAQVAFARPCWRAS